MFYELHVGTFTAAGTLDAAIERLDHLVSLGVDVVEVMPVAAFPGTAGWGYDGVHPYAVHEPYGGPDALKRFVDACHARGLAVCLDVVYNHLGPSGNYLPMFGPYFTDKHHTPWGSAVNLDDEGSADVRRWIIDNALMWLRDFHVDALRLDAVHAMEDDSPVHVLAELAREVDALSVAERRPLSLVAESDLNIPATVLPVEAGGLGMTAQWSDDFHHALHTLLTGEGQGYYADFAEDPYDALTRTLTGAFFHDGRHSSFRGAPWGAPVDRATVPGWRFMGYLQTHDQVGNRAVGDRIGHGISDGLARIGAALVFTSPFTPMLFMGEEWGASTPWQYFTSHEEPELADAVRQGRRREFAAHGWASEDVPDPQDPATVRHLDAALGRAGRPGPRVDARLAPGPDRAAAVGAGAVRPAPGPGLRHLRLGRRLGGRHPRRPPRRVQPRVDCAGRTSRRGCRLGAAVLGGRVGRSRRVLLEVRHPSRSLSCASPPRPYARTTRRSTERTATFVHRRLRGDAPRRGFRRAAFVHRRLRGDAP